MSNELVVIAHNVHEMAQAQANVANWAEDKARDARESELEILEGLRVAKEHKWATSALSKAATLARKQREFYHKIAAASRLGYAIVPNFPIDVFAIRTKRLSPVAEDTPNWSTHRQSSESPPAGEGVTVSAIPSVDTEVRDDTNYKGEAIKRRFSWATAFRDVQFPLAAVKPMVLDDAGRAMAAGIFDEIGISPQGIIRSPKRHDPMVIGQVIYRPKNKVVSFLISWWMTNSDLEIR